MIRTTPGPGPRPPRRTPRPRALACAAVLLGLAAGLLRLAAVPPASVPGAPATRAEDLSPRRVVSLVPSVTELVVALGAGKRLVGRTRYDALPALAALPSVGGPADPALEPLMALEPDLVVTWAGVTPPRVEARLRRAGITVLAASVEGIPEVLVWTARLGRLLDAEAAAAAVAGRLTTGLAALERDRDRSLEGRLRPTVLLLLDLAPPLTAGPGSYLDELVTLAGGRNAFPDVGPWSVVGVEAVLSRDPDALVVSAREGRRPLAELRAAAGWRSLRAVREGAVLVLPAAAVTRPGPDMLHVGRAMADFFRDVAGSP